MLTNPPLLELDPVLAEVTRADVGQVEHLENVLEVRRPRSTRSVSATPDLDIVVNNDFGVAGPDEYGFISHTNEAIGLPNPGLADENDNRCLHSRSVILSTARICPWRHRA